MFPSLNAAPRVTREQVAGMLTGEFRNAVENLDEEFASKTQVELEDMRKPTEIDFLLRKKLWQLAEVGLNEEIQPIEIYGDICSRQTFFVKVITSPLRVAWLMTPPQEDKTRMEAGLSIGITNLVKFVSKEPTSETAGAFIKAIEFLYNRVHGPMVQRIDARHAHMKVTAPSGTEPLDVNARLEALKQKLVGSGSGEAIEGIRADQEKTSVSKA